MAKGIARMGLQRILEADATRTIQRSNYKENFILINIYINNNRNNNIFKEVQVTLITIYINRDRMGTKYQYWVIYF